MSHGVETKRGGGGGGSDGGSSAGPPPPDGGWGWMVVFGSFMIHIIADGMTYSFGIYHDEFVTYFNEGEAKTALISSILVGVTLCSGPISSALVNRYGCRPVTIAGAVVATCCMIVSCFAEDVDTLCITIGLLTGLGFGFIYLPAIVSVTTYFEKKRSLATGIAVCGSGLGTFIFAPLLAAIKSEYGWRGSLLIISALVLNCTIFGAFFRPLEDDERGKSDVDAEGDESIALKPSEALSDLHISAQDLHLGEKEKKKGIHRPRSMGHFSVPRTYKIEENANIPESDVARLALSQPMLTQRHFGGSQHGRHGPIDRIDVFYQGSLMNIPSYKSKLDLQHENDVLGRRRTSTYSYRRRIEPTKLPPERVVFCGISLSAETVNTLKDMLDLSLFRDELFMLFTLSNFLTSIGFNIPYLYTLSRTQELGVEHGERLIALIGLSNTVGRIVLGYISDKPWCNRLLVYNLCLTICGFSTALSIFCTSFVDQALYCIVYGFTIGAYVGLTSVILVDLLGLDKLTNAFGLLLLFQGFASLIGPPLAGALKQHYGHYGPCFILGGVAMALSGLILFPVPAIQRRKERRQRRRQAIAPHMADI